ncbi:DUF1064 domain-containing protein [Falsihalocynthiibacter sp. S25ZX9]|uniref:DUF1064 domain-containing protein n=1 Tax=Falsihalocynthiibacter sp. S25ZX9 TaxID=3240870 RepID=UPI0035100F2B
MRAVVERMSAAEFKAKTTATKKKNKFNAKAAFVDGIRFDSQHEADCYCDKRIEVRAGLISDLKLQVVVFLIGRDGPLKTRKGRDMRLTVDFTYIDNATRLLIHADAKGAITRDYEVRRAVAAAQGVEVLEL